MKSPFDNLIPFILATILIAQNSPAQDYVWPTDASHALTSSFAEYRPGRFHAGIDIKTWGQIGYKIFAIGSGHISRIRVSPFGYGRAVYLSLDTGESVVYAHLSKFNDAIDAYVREEQERRGRYSIEIYPDSRQFQVQQGDLLGYTGQSGVGYPHLHFEMRDNSERPVNPFLRGYKVEDTVAPTVSKISISPIDAASTVEGDWRPMTLVPTRITNGEYRIDKPILVYGRIGFGVSAYDEMNGVENNLGVYRSRLIVDNQEVFSAAYDRFPYDQNDQSNLDRDFRLFMQGKGIFYKLYRDLGNTLSFYAKPDFYYGVISFGAGAARSTLLQGALSLIGMQAQWPEGVIDLPEGEHDFQIAVEDFWGNQSNISGRLLARRKEKISLQIAGDSKNGTLIGEAQGQNGTPLSKCSLFVSLNGGQSWQPVLNLSQKRLFDSANAGKNGNSSSFLFPLSTVSYLSAPFLLRAIAQDSNGLATFPAYALVNNQTTPGSDEPMYQLDSEFYDNYVRLEFVCRDPRPCFSAPEVTAWHENGVAEPLQLIPSGPGKFYGSWPLSQKESGPIPLEMVFIDREGKKIIQKEWLRFTAVPRNKSKRVASEDGLCFVDFTSGSLYRDMFLRMQVIQPESLAFYDVASKVYVIEPKDVPMQRGATISLAYSAGDTLADKLAVYYRSGERKWTFLGNRFDKVNGTISGRASSFGTYCLIRDVNPPLIHFLQPGQNARLTAAFPTLQANFIDRLSGINGDEDMEMLLDGRKVIAEYDPEQNLLFYTPRKALAKGRHKVDFRVWDRCGNRAENSHVFWID
jgi:hypothetical protein